MKRKDDGPLLRVSLGFDPVALGEEKSEQVFQGMGAAVKPILGEEGVPKFMQQLQAAGKKARAS